MSNRRIENDKESVLYYNFIYFTCCKLLLHKLNVNLNNIFAFPQVTQQFYCFQQLKGFDGTFIDLNEVKNHVKQWKHQHLLGLSEVRLQNSYDFKKK